MFFLLELILFVVIVVVNCGLLIVGQGERRPKRPPNEHKI